MEKLFRSKLSQHTRLCGIYLIKISTHLYVGSAINLSSRLNNHRSSMRSNSHKNSYIQSCFNKHGKNACFYSILEYCSKENRLKKEKVWIENLHSDLNLIKDPTTQNNCITTSKPVYQYTLSGNFLSEFSSASEAGRVLNIDNHTITKVCTGKHGHKSYNKSLWSYKKYDILSEYVNNSKKSKIKSVTMYDKTGIKLKTFDSIANAARFIQEPGDNFDGLCACISSVAHGKGKFVKDKYTYSYQQQEKLIIKLNRDFPIIQVHTNDTYTYWENAITAAKVLKASAAGIHKVLRGERKKYLGCVWSIRSDFKTP